MKKSYKFVLSFTFLFVFVGALATQVFATNLIGYPAVAQAKTNWCWAASGSSILRYYGYEISQCSFDEYVKGTTGCPTNDSEGYTDVQHGLNHFGVSSWSYDGSLTYSVVKSQIDDEGSPIYVSWGWTAGGGHAVVIYGYDTIGSTDYVQYMNPASGTKTSITYAEMKGGSGYDHTWRWGLHTFYKF